MNYLFRGHVIEGTETLPHNHGHIFFIELHAAEHVCKEVAALAVVSHDEKHIVHLPYLSQIQNIRVIQLAHYLEFLNETVYLMHLAHVYRLNSHSLGRQSVLGLIDNTKTALAHFFLKKVLVFDVTSLGSEKLLTVHDDILVDPLVDLGILRRHI